jgi:hypothetical protein
MMKYDGEVDHVTLLPVSYKSVDPEKSNNNNVENVPMRVVPLLRACLVKHEKRTVFVNNQEAKLLALRGRKVS